MYLGRDTLGADQVQAVVSITKLYTFAYRSFHLRIDALSNARVPIPK
jgi:hypothetical protein